MIILFRVFFILTSIFTALYYSTVSLIAALVGGAVAGVVALVIIIIIEYFHTRFPHGFCFRLYRAHAGKLLGHLVNIALSV